MSMSRRQILKGALFGGTVLGLGMVGVRSSTFTNAGLLVPVEGTGVTGTRELLARALRLRKMVSFGGNEAHAEETKKVAVVHVKVMNQMHTPLVLRLGELSDPATGSVTVTDQVAMSRKAPASEGSQNGQEQGFLDAVNRTFGNATAEDKRFQDLRVNQWFGRILREGSIGTNLGQANRQTPAAVAGYAAPFPAAGEVALQFAVGLKATAAHSALNMVLDSDGGDVAYHLFHKGVVRSPLGITAFDMGGEKESNFAVNSVINGSGGIAAQGTSVAGMTNLVRSVVGENLVSYDLTSKFDRLAASSSQIRQKLEDNRVALLQGLEDMTVTAGYENSEQLIGAGARQRESALAVGAARTEFLAQCRWVVDALGIPGQPLRAFTLDLHVGDLDTERLDSGRAGSGNASKGLSYVEGMKQLALGLNVLAQVIRDRRATDGLHVYVVVTTEGGRDEGLGDNETAMSIFMGPGANAPNGLADAFYAPADAFVRNSNVARDPNGSSIRAALPMRDNGLVSFSGATVNAPTTNANLLHGIVRHLEEVVGAAPTTSAAFGNRSRIRTAV